MSGNTRTDEATDSGYLSAFHTFSKTPTGRLNDSNSSQNTILPQTPLPATDSPAAPPPAPTRTRTLSTAPPTSTPYGSLIDFLDDPLTTETAPSDLASSSRVSTPTPRSAPSPSPAMSDSSNGRSRDDKIKRAFDKLQRNHDSITGDNWAEWDAQIVRSIVLASDEAYAVFSGRLAKQSPADAEYLRWARACEELRDFFQLALGHRMDALDRYSGNEIYPTLKKTYGYASSTGDRLGDIRALRDLRMDPNQTVREYYEEIKRLVGRLNDKYRTFKPREDKSDEIGDAQVYDFLVAGLTPELYTLAVTHYDVEKNLESLVGILSRLQTNAASEAVAFAATRPSPSTPKNATRFTPRPPKPSTPSPRPQAAPSLQPMTPVPSTPARRPRYTDARQVPHARKWSLFFNHPTKGWRFRLDEDQCYMCLGKGHRSPSCALKDKPNEWKAAQKDKFASIGIHLEPYEIRALISVISEENAILQTEGAAGYARFITVDPNEPTPLAAVAVAEHSIPAIPHDAVASAYGLISILARNPFSPLVDLPDTDPSLDPIALPAMETYKPFIWDTGASIHLTTCRELLHDYVELPSSARIRVSGAFGSSGEVLGRGTLVGTFDIGDGMASRLRIGGVYYAPTVGHNLISGLTLYKLGYSTSNTSTSLTLHDPAGAAIAIFPFSAASTSIVIKASWDPSPASRNLPADALPVSSSAGAQLWHARCGHCGEERLKQAARAGSIGMDWNGIGSLPPCEDCALGKMVRRPVSKVAKSRSEAPGERLHCDSLGKLPTPGRLRREQHALGLVDDFSRFSWVFGMHSRTEAPELIRQTIARIEREKDTLIKRFRRDGAKELASAEMKGFFAEKGIQVEGTTPYEHQENGVVERHWRTITSMARTCLLASGLPETFWFLALAYANYVNNRLPSSANEDKSPYELYHGTVPDVSNFRTFGALAYVLIDSTLRTKFSPRSRPCYFVGFVENSKGWLFYDPAVKSFFQGVQVKWFEGKTFRDRTDVPWLEEQQRAIRDWEFEGVLDEKAEQGVNVEKAKGVPQEDKVDAAPAPPSSSPPPRPPRSPQRLVDRLRGVQSPSPTRRATRSPSPTTARPQRHTRLPERYRQGAAFLATAQLDLGLSHLEPGVRIVAELDDDAQVAVVSPSTPDSPTLRQALNGPERSLWLSAMDAEREAFRLRGVLDEETVDLPPGARAIKLKWVLLIKRDEAGRVLKYKARLVARGDMQREGIDFDQVWSPTVRFASVLALFGLAVNEDLDIRRFDVTTAFLHGSIDEELYVTQLPGFVDPVNPSKVHRLRRSLYGLRQAGRKWSETFMGHLRGLGFQQCPHDHSLYIRRRNGKVVFLPIHVDDGLLFGDDDLDEVIRDLNSRLDGCVKEEPLTLFLGVRIRKFDDGSIMLDQGHYIEKVLERFDLDTDTSRPTRTPTPFKADISPIRDDEVVTSKPYRALLGSLIYASTCTRVDIAYAVGVASRWANSPTERHWSYLVHIARYLRWRKFFGPHFRKGRGREVSGWTDADFAMDPATRRSVTGWVFCIAGAAISWRSKRQPTVTVSSTEAEYLALSSAVREAVWLRNLFSSLGYPPDGPTRIRGDNRSCITLAEHPASHHRTKHIPTHAHYSRERVADGTVVLEWVPTDDLPADMLTKGLVEKKHLRFCDMLGLAESPLEGVCWLELVDGCEGRSSARFMETV